MSETFTGNAIFCHYISDVEGGNAAKTAALLKRLGFNEFSPKIADGYAQMNPGLTRAYVDTLHNAGIKVTGFVAPYGANPAAEGKLYTKLVNDLGLDGLIFDVETTFENKPEAIQNTRTILANFTASVPTAFCSWARHYSPSGTQWHPVNIAQEWLKRCDYGMPMMYWYEGGPDRAVWMLEEAIRQWGLFTDKPIIAAGRAYNGDGGTALPSAMKTFAETAREKKNIRQITWWSMDHAIKLGLTDTLAEINAVAQPTQPTGDYVTRKEFDDLLARLRAGYQAMADEME